MIAGYGLVLGFWLGLVLGLGLGLELVIGVWLWLGLRVRVKFKVRVRGGFRVRVSVRVRIRVNLTLTLTKTLKLNPNLLSYWECCQNMVRKKNCVRGRALEAKHFSNNILKIGRKSGILVAVYTHNSAPISNVVAYGKSRNPSRLSYS